ncbi:MAG TPA: hypothetical protein VHE55_16800 [Fimbriimonadaceae bacterium]|nr:hypothetical protein [Fimbriimonadaceae bacterium]
MLAAVAALAGTSIAGAQQAGDYGHLNGAQSRQGKNGDPVNFGPGPANLTWFWPNGVNRPGTIVRDNPSTAAILGGTWNAPTIDQEGAYFYQIPRTNNATLDPIRGWVANAPGYLYSPSIPSSLGSHDDPTVTPGASTFTWVIDPTVENPATPSGNYQLYAWIPTGPTGPVPPGNITYWPNRYYVFAIDYANGSRWIDVVDTNVSGEGWVRLGNGGMPTNQVFPYTGTPLRITLYNVMWRDSLDNILEYTGTDTNPVYRAVYADAVMAVPDNGSISATPVISQIGTGINTRNQAILAANRTSATFVNGRAQSIVTPEVDAFQYNGLAPNLNAPFWKWTPLEVTPYTTTLDNVVASHDLTWASENIVNHFGNDYLTNTITNSNANPEMVTYSPTLEDGDYLIQVYCGGNGSGQVFGTQTTIYVYEGANVTQIPIDQTIPGWVTISNQRFQHRGSVGENLRVAISNYSPNAADAGAKAYADEVRFIGSFNEQINSTPVQTKAFITPQGGGAPVEKDVVLVACDDGHLYCLDAMGNGNGTTTVYWAYPSILPTGVLDPNRATNLDGDGTNIMAQMPSDGFGLSSPLVQRINGVDYAFIAAKNGRVYCINMAGRGDYNPATGQIGTTNREWSFPNDWPAPVRQNPITGGFGGSVAYASTATNGPTIFIPASEGRLYAVDAIAHPNHTTIKRWTYPNITVPTVGPITTTPTLDFGNVYFGTARASDTVPGQFYALNADTGAFKWVFEGDPNTIEADSFVGGACTATQAQLGGTNDMIFCANYNLMVYGLDANTGTLLWQTDELNTPVSQNLMFTWMNVPDQTGTTVPFPIVMVPTDDGRFDGLFARASDVNVDNQKLAWEYLSASDSLTASMSNGWNFMYGADNSGNLYAWSANGAVGGMGTAPGSQAITANNPIAQMFRNAKITPISAKGYKRLRESSDSTGDIGTLTQAQALAFAVSRTAYEWGETAYFLVYDFPFLDQDQGGNTITPPIVNFQIGVEGASVRQYGVQSKEFLGGGNPNGDGYAILAFPIQGAGPTSLPPGGATVKFSFSTAGANSNGTVQTIDANNPLQSTKFTVANPLGIYMPAGTTNNVMTGGASYGVSTDPGNIERQTNGSRGAPLLSETLGVTPNGQTGIGGFWLVDMSMLTLLKGPTRGLEQVRLNRPSYVWQGGAGSVVNPIDQTLYPGFEDLPVNYPNVSLDYPNIGREYVHATKDPNGEAENAIVSTNGFSLTPPTLPANFDDGDINQLEARGLNAVYMQISVDVPRFQPANNGIFSRGVGDDLPSGYLTRVDAYVDSNGNSILDSISGRREAFRAFTSTLAVPVDERIAVTTPTVDMGTLAGGTGYGPSQPGFGPSGNVLSPWDSRFTSMTDLNGNVVNPIISSNPDFVNLFKPFNVENQGNVNVLNARLAKATYNPNPAFPSGPWPIYADSVDDLGWLDVSKNVWTNFDWNFGLMPKILLQKARVGDVVPTQLDMNPTERYNPNIGVLQQTLFPNSPTSAPKIAVTPPIGMPVGLYSQNLVVIDDERPNSGVGQVGDQTLELDTDNSPLEAISNPGFTIKFTVRETRLTTSFTTATAPMIDVPQSPSDPVQALTWGNLQPAGMRLPNGNLVVAWTSPRPSFNAAWPTIPTTDPEYGIYISTLKGSAPSSGDVPPLSDIDNWGAAANNRWFRQEVGPFPNGSVAYDTLFQSTGGDTVIPTSVKFGSPAFPTNGLVDPLGGSNFTSSVMAFVGSAQKQNAGGRRDTESRILIANVGVNGSGAATVNNLHAMPFDPNMTKGRPSVYQVQGGAVIFYTEAGTGEGQMFYTVTDGADFVKPSVFSVGNGFEQVSSPSVQLRLYGNPFSLGSKPIIEMSFIGKLRGRANSEVFYGRMLTSTTFLNGNTIPNTPGGVDYLPSQFGEQLKPDSEAGVYRAQGIMWNQRAQFGAYPEFHLYQDLNGVVSELEDSANLVRSVDRQSGLIQCQTKLGVAYVDPSLGTVRFANSIPAKAAKVYLSYQPRFMRISESNVAGHATPTVLWDNRIVGNLSNDSYWFRVNSNGTVTNIDPNTSNPPRAARYVFMYTRAASGAGQAARPYWKSMRLGVQLGTSIYTDSGGNIQPGDLVITGTTNPVQVDPASGRIYFQAGDEDHAVTISYAGIDPATGQRVMYPAATYNVSMVTERAESPVPIDQAVNESGITPFLDPFDNSPRRPGLIWMFFTSTRAGNADIYLQTMAPRFTPTLNGK